MSNIITTYFPQAIFVMLDSVKKLYNGKLMMIMLIVY